MRVVADAPALARAAVELWREAAAEAVRARGRFVAAISGGKTPLPVYALLAAEPGLPWRETELFLADERCVPEGHPDSNLGAAREALLAHVPARAHPVAVEREPEEAARAYDAELGAAGPLDLVLLGIGADGHTASLFPGSPALLVRDRLAVAARAPAGLPGPWRVTLTFAALDAARRVVFLVEGAAKRATVARVLAGDDLPAAKVRAAEVLLLVTRDAAA